MKLPGTLKWIGLALLGLAIAAAVAIAASNLASRQIGIASESISAGDRLAPPTRTTRSEPDSGHGDGGNRLETSPTSPSTTPTVPAEPPSITPVTPSEGGDDYGSGSGGDGDSDD